MRRFRIQTMPQQPQRPRCSRRFNKKLAPITLLRDRGWVRADRAPNSGQSVDKAAAGGTFFDAIRTPLRFQHKENAPVAGVERPGRVPRTGEIGTPHARCWGSGAPGRASAGILSQAFVSCNEKLRAPMRNCIGARQWCGRLACTRHCVNRDTCPHRPRELLPGQHSVRPLSW